MVDGGFDFRIPAGQNKSTGPAAGRRIREAEEVDAREPAEATRGGVQVERRGREQFGSLRLNIAPKKQREAGQDIAEADGSGCYRRARMEVGDRRIAF